MSRVAYLEYRNAYLTLASGVRPFLPTVNKHRDESIFQALVCDKRFVSTGELRGNALSFLLHTR